MAAPATDPDTLFTLSHCFRCYGVNGTSTLLKLGLLVQIVLAANPSADVTPQTLIASANCYNCYSNGDFGALFEMALLKLLVQSIE